MSSEYTPHEQFADQSDDYLDQHNIYDLFGGLLKQLAIHKPKDPYSFMLSLLDQPSNVLKIIIVGVPGAGKDTQVAKIVQEYGVVPVRVDSLIREELQNKTAVGAKIKGFQDKKQPIPEELITTIVGTRVNKQDCVKQGWLLDGYPTSRIEAQSLQAAQAGILCNKFVWLQCSDKIARGRFENSSKFADMELTSSQVTDMYASFHRNIKQYADLFTDVRGFISTEQGIEESWRDVKNFLERTPISKAPRRPMRMLMLGPTGAGKATQCAKLSQRHGLVHLSTGALLRKEADKSEALHEKVAEFMAAGALVPDDIVCPIVCARLLQSDCRERGWLLDGFPRTPAQADALEKHKLMPNRCVLLDVPEPVAMSRLLKRRIDPITGDIYQLEEDTPDATVADRLVTQPKDQENNARTLLMEYYQSIEGLSMRYAKIFKKFDGTQSRVTVASDIEHFMLSSLGASSTKIQED